MLHTKTVKVTQSPALTVGDRIVTFLRQPLFSFPVPITKERKPEPPAQVKTREPEKAAIKTKPKPRPMPPSGRKKPIPPRYISPNEITAIYCFSPSLNKVEYEKVLFVLRACERNSGKPFTNALHVESLKSGSRLVATDGKRLHAAMVRTKIEPGDYKPIVSGNMIRLGMPVTDINFPDWKRVVPKETVRRGYIDLGRTAIGDMHRLSAHFTKLTGEKVNPNYLMDLTMNAWGVYCQNEKGKALLLKEYGAERETFAVIMPLA